MADEQEKPVVDDADAKLANLVNSAVTSQLKRHMKGFNDTLGSMLDEKLSAFKPTEPAKPSPGKVSSDIDPNAEVEQLRNELKSQRDELKAQKIRGFEKEVFADVRSLLAGKVRPEAMDTAIKLLRADGSIKIDARDGTATMKTADGVVDLSDGIAAWLSGEGALLAVPAMAKKPLVRGPHRAPPRPIGAGNEALSPAQKTAQQLSALGLSLG